MSRLLILFLLTSCSSADVATMTMAPTLACAVAWRCNLIAWKIGLDYGPKVVGMHGGCFCREADK